MLAGVQGVQASAGVLAGGLLAAGGLGVQAAGVLAGGGCAAQRSMNTLAARRALSHTSSSLQ